MKAVIGRPMDKKCQNFCQLHSGDLRDHRDAATKAILEIGHLPIGMETFSAADDDSWTLIQRQIDQCDYYLVIVAHRHGSTASDGASFAEKEYDCACTKEIPVLGFVIGDSVPWSPDAAAVPEVLADLSRLSSENAELRSRLQVPHAPDPAFHLACSPLASESDYRLADA